AGVPRPSTWRRSPPCPSGCPTAACHRYAGWSAEACRGSLDNCGHLARDTACCKRVTGMRARWVLSVGLLLVGCKLIDQATFAPSPEAPASKPEAPKADPRTPLVTIGYASPTPDYQDMLRYAVREAETRVPGIQYDVVAILPAGADA